MIIKRDGLDKCEMKEELERWV